MTYGGSHLHKGGSKGKGAIVTPVSVPKANVRTVGRGSPQSAKRHKAMHPGKRHI